MAAAESWQAHRTLGYPWVSQVTRTTDNDRPVPEGRGLVVVDISDRAAIGAAGARPLQQEDHSVGASQEDVDIHDGAVAIRRKGTFWPAVLLERAEIVVRAHSRRA